MEKRIPRTRNPKNAGRRFFAALLLGAALLSAISTASAQVFPAYLNYQGKLADSSGNPLSGSFSFSFKLYASASSATPLFTDLTYSGGNAVNVSNGVYSVQIGSMTPGGIPPSVFFNSEVWLEIAVNSGVSLLGAETLAPRERLATSPFAFLASNAEFLGAGVNIATFTAGGVLQVPYGITAATADFTNTSGFSLTTSSGISVAGGGVYAPFFVGDGSALTGINAGGETNTFTSSKTFTGDVLMKSSAVVSGDYFSVGGSTLVVSNGGVGIGTTSPAFALDVNGGAMLRSSATWAAMSAPAPSALGQGAIYFDSITHQFMVSQNGVSYIPLGGQTAGGWTEGGGLVVLSTPTDYVVIQSTLAVLGDSFSVGASTLVVTDGSVGIGLTNPAYALDVAGSGQFATALLSPLLQPLTGGGNGLTIQANSGNFSVGAQLTVGGGSNSPSFGGTLALSGGVGEGYGGGPVQIAGGANYPFGGYGYYGAPGEITVEGSQPIQAGNVAAGGSITLNSGAGYNGGAEGSVLFQVAGTEKARVDASGNVGIGNTSPQASLDVAAGAGSGAAAIFRNPSGVAVATVTASGIFAGTQQWMFTLYDPTGLTTADNVPAVISNRVSTVTVHEVWCESDDPGAAINLQRNSDSQNILNAQLTCGTAGAATTSLTAANLINFGDGINYIMVSVGAAAKRVNVVIRYTIN